MTCKLTLCLRLSRIHLKREGKRHTVGLPCIHLAAWNTEVLVRALVAILDHENERLTPGIVE